MANMPIKIDVKAALNRMAEVMKATTMSQLAELLGLEANALNQSKYRGSIPLHLLLNCAEKSGASLDYLVYGKKAAGGEKAGKSEFVKLDAIEGGGKNPVGFDQKWLESLYPDVDITKLKIYSNGHEVAIVDTSDTTVTDGIYILGHDDIIIIRECKRQLDGQIKIEDEDNLFSQNTLLLVGVKGKVIWSGEGL